MGFKTMTERINDLIAFGMKFKGKKPDYIIMSRANSNELNGEYCANVVSYAGIPVHIHVIAGPDFLQVGWGSPT